MEHPDLASATHLPDGLEVKSPPVGLSRVSMMDSSWTNMTKKEETSVERGEDPHLDSLEVDETQHNSGDSIEPRADTQLDTQTEPGTQTQRQGESGEEGVDVDTSCDSGTASMEDARTPPAVLDGAGGPLDPPPTNLDEVVESSSSVLEGTIESSLLVSEEVKEPPPAPTLDPVVEPSSSVLDCSIESPPTIVDGAIETSSPAPLAGSVYPSPSKTNSTQDPVVPNGPTTPSSTTPPQAVDTAPDSNCSSSPYDTDCSRKLMSQIHRSVSQESLLDELEAELLSCQLPEGRGVGRKGSPVNGMQTDQEGSMVVFEKCAQFKYLQQEKAVKR